MDSYVLALGKLIGNFHSLEFALRGFLYNRDPTVSFASGHDIASLRVGDEVPVNAFTNYDTLGDLIEKYNRLVGPERQIDSALVQIRDALAHGRLSSAVSEFPLTLLKFARPPRGGTTTVVTWAEEISADWLAVHRARVFDAVTKVATQLIK